MKSFSIHPQISMMESAEEFCERFAIGEGDLVFVSNGMKERHFGTLLDKAEVINYRAFGKGEPTDLMVEGIAKSIQNPDYKRVIAIGGGTILDVAKLFALEKTSPVTDLFEKKFPAKKTRDLILVPTTCGTGSEVTNVSILELTTLGTKFGLADDALYADDAVLIPALLKGLPEKVFATSSIDALVHSVESFTSPKATPFTRIFSTKAMQTILDVYENLSIEGLEKRDAYSERLLTASCFAGIAFGNAGCAAVHAMSYPLGAKYHVAHGESNYCMFTGVYKKYMELQPEGAIEDLNRVLADCLGCEPSDVYLVLDKLLQHILPKKALHEYGVTKDDLTAFTESVMTKQGRLMANNYTKLSADTVLSIYQELY